MRSKLPMIGGSSATFKSSLLVLFGPCTKRLLCKFEKKLIEMCHLNPQYSFYLFKIFRIVTGSPEDDPKENKCK